MGHGLSMPERPLSALALAVASPAVATSFMQLIERLAMENVSPMFAKSLGALMKVCGCPFFVAGHYSICLKKPKLEYPDVCYMSGCSILTCAFLGAYRGKPLPEGVLACAPLLFGAYLPLVYRLRKAGASPLVPGLGACGAACILYQGLVLMGLKHRVITSFPPRLPPAELGTIGGAFLGVANCLKLAQMIQQRVPRDNQLLGQFFKVLASFVCFFGNCLILGWHKRNMQPDVMLPVAAAAVVAMIRQPSSKKAQ